MMLFWSPYYIRPPHRNTCAHDGGPRTVFFRSLSLPSLSFLTFLIGGFIFHLSHAGVVHHEEVHLKVVRARSLDLNKKQIVFFKLSCV